MSAEERNLELEIERELARWSGQLDVEPDQAQLGALRTVIQHELGDTWLAAQPVPEPAIEVMARIRETIRTELTGIHAHGSPFSLPAINQRRRQVSFSRWISAQGWASLGAAAMLLLCVGIVRYVANRPIDSSVDMNALASVFTTASATDSIQSEVISLEEATEDEWVPVDRDESLEELVQEMDQILEEHEPAQRTSAYSSTEKGVLG